MMQTNLFDLIKKKGKLGYSGSHIHYHFRTIQNHIDQNLYHSIDKWSKWYWRRNRLYWASINYTIWIKTYEMLSANKSKTKKTNME